MSALHRLAAAVGVQIGWQDATGQPQHVSDEALRRVLTALGHPADSDAAVESSIESRLARNPPPLVAADGGRAILIPGLAGEDSAALEQEDGTVHRVPVERTAEGLRIPPIAAAGYHRLHLGERTITLAVAPDRCLGTADLAPGRRLWGPAVQVPALRAERATDFGDFATLASAARAFAGKGADAVAISPTHALFPADASRFSPYAPSSRLFHNILFGDPLLAGGPVAEAQTGDLIDWHAAMPARLAALRHAFAARDETVASAVAAYRVQRGRDLERHATFDALHAHFFAADGARGWQDWPAAYHDPDSVAVDAFARAHRAEIDFYIFAQWLADTSLGAAQSQARDAGMAVGLIADLAVGMDGGGSHAWSHRGDLLTGLSIGAPPDPLGPEGQDWGITGFAPDALRSTGFAGFIETVRAATRNTGGLRIDHVLGLRRLWVIPHGSRSVEGAYLTYPLDDLLRLIALESHRSRAIVIGEDLGTVPEGLRPKLASRGLMGMRVLWFERDDAGRYRSPRDWEPDAAAMTGTHDTPTVVGWWRGRDIDWRERLGKPAAEVAEDRRQRQDDRGQLWQAFTRAGTADGPAPAPERGVAVADAALAFVGATPATLAIVPMEDVAALVEQPNLPGTTDQHPNWRRRMPEAVDTILARPDVAARLARLDAERRT
ncbi:4-alpha-glucanotransferase [Stakelama saccharophila]|uniref:4-alpha-glucanotransferase n=1 Tax=Stakelama saccharophila TaxID=3075605 RepID=A0ABZ0B8C9_9SPHN|nr:4-alpha-glucanotransferase [Stakelama sp. W311]WNO53654.1 4-alpha-glucanotransferase [Stakelama sp. W311]